MIQRKAPLKRGKPPKRSTKAIKRSPLPKATKPIRAKKKDPARRRFAAHRDKPFTDWVSSLGCHLYRQNVGTCAHPWPLILRGHYADPAHVVPRSRGSDDKGNVVNLCRKHHNEQEGKTAAFEAKYSVDLKALALELANRYDAD